MELNEIIENSSQIYNNECDNNIKQCCIIKDFKFGAIDMKCDGILLTPICEILQNKADYLTIAQILPLKEFYETFLEQKGLTGEQILGLETISATKFGDTYHNFKSNFLTNQVYRFYFLPENEGIIVHSIIDFNLIESLPINDFVKYKKICEVNNPWKADIIANYTAYSVRMGIDDYSKDFIEKIMSDISRLRKNT